MNLPECPSPKASPRHVAVRCGHCPACVEVRTAIYAMFDKGMTAMQIAKKHGIPPRVPMGLRTSWRALREVDGFDKYVQRPLCDCGLSITDTHTKETCDMRAPRSTGMGQMGTMTW